MTFVLKMRTTTENLRPRLCDRHVCNLALDRICSIFSQDIIQDFDQFYSEEFSRLEEKRNYVKEIVKDLHVSYVILTQQSIVLKMTVNLSLA
jgi:hypothetical protein